MTCSSIVRSSVPGSAALLGLAAMLLFLAGPVQAQEKEPFTDARFAELQEAGAVILLDVFADWCPTCAQQQRVLAAFQEAHPEAPLHILTVDFDDQKEVVTRFQAPRQSTLILYRGTERIWFSVAETRQAAIFEQLLEALGGM